MLHPEFISKGFCIIKPDFYLTQENASSVPLLKKLFDHALQDDGLSFRKRAYLKLRWIQKTGQIHVPQNQFYYQTSLSNRADGGKIRQFKVMDQSVLDIPIINSLLSRNLQIIENYSPLQSENYLTIGLHFIRYEVNEAAASYSSPDWLHKDDEPLVFVHLVNLSGTALGGDNLIADSDTQKITHVVRLENDMDTLVLNKNVYHAVTPLGSRQGVSIRDVILFTVEPSYTQQLQIADACA